MVNHILTVRGREASVTPRTLVQGTVGQDTLTLDLDSEWNGLNVTVTFVAAATEITPVLTANVCEIPHEVLVDSGEIDVFVLGTRDGKTMRHASLAHKMIVKKSNMSDGSTASDPSISAYRQAYDDAVKATEAANSAAGAAGSTVAEMDALNKRYETQISQQATAFSTDQIQRANDFSTAQTQRANDFSTAQTQRAHDFDSAMQGYENEFNEAEEERAAAETERVKVEKERVKAEEKRTQDSKTRLEELAQAKTDAETAARKADASAKKADIATGKANEATVAATNAATKANEVEAKLTGNILKGKTKDTFIHVDDVFPSSLLGIVIEGATAQGSTTGANLFDVRKFIPNNSAYGLTASVEDGFICIRGTASGIGDIQSPSFSIGQYADNSLSGKQLNLKIFGAPSYITRVYGLRTVDETQIAVVASIHDGDKVDCKFLLAVSVDTLAEYEPYTGGKPSPSHEYPQEISNIGKVELKVAGKNFADVDESNNVNFILRKEPLPAGTYTFSCDKGRGSGFRFNVKPIDASGKVVEKDIATNAVSPCTITISEPMGLYVNGWGLTAPYGIGGIQLEVGSKATDFEPISKPKATQID